MRCGVLRGIDNDRRKLHVQDLNLFFFVVYLELLLFLTHGVSTLLEARLEVPHYQAVLEDSLLGDGGVANEFVR